MTPRASSRVLKDRRDKPGLAKCFQERIPRERLHEQPGRQMSFWTPRGRYLPQAKALAESLGVTVERRYDASLLEARGADRPDNDKST